MFLRNLNLFFPYFSLLSSTLGTMLTTSFYLLLIKISPHSTNPKLIPYAPHLLIALVLIIVWWRIGLSPSTFIPEREQRFKHGHTLVAIANLLSIGTVAFTLLSAFKYGTVGNMPFLFAPLALAAFVAWIVGVIMIWSSWKNA
jgi:hypothetical protein